MCATLSRIRALGIRHAQNIRTVCKSSAVSRKAEVPRGLGDDDILIGNSTFRKDGWTNVTPRVLSHVGSAIYLQDHHPLSLIRQKIVKYMYRSYVNRSGNPLFSVYDRLSPIVTLEQNFDSLLVPDGHPSRKHSDSYYINAHYMLRAHTSAHQRDLILAGLNNFLVIGDVYRRDEIDKSHYPVFHQLEAVRLLSRHELFRSQKNPDSFSLFEEGERCNKKQESHTFEAALMMEHDLKNCLVGLAKSLFGNDVEHRWVGAYFPFTHPSWELEIHHNNQWMEVLGCGIMEQKILHNSGAGDKIGWAFGLGLERLAMKLYSIPDIRLFWSKDTGFLSQFKVNVDTPVTYKPVSVFPQCINDISFWVPAKFDSKDFYEIVRSVGGDLIEQVNLKDVFFHEKKQRTSYCFRIVYRHMERTLRQDEVNAVHQRIEAAAAEALNVVIR